MNFNEMINAVNEARATLAAGDRCVWQMVSLIAGRLRISGANHSDLKKLKQELADYNIHTGKWKDSK